MVIVENGQPVHATLRLEQMPLDEVMEAARQQGIAHLSEVRLGVLEPSGKLSFIKVTDQPAREAGNESDG
jgi:uncharacterized membrane protein YcaP (DUF421 family)